MTILARPSTGQTIAATHVDQLVDLYKGNQIFDLVNGYGCDPTGAVECSTIVNQAFTDAAASGKGAVVTGYGTLKVNATIKCASDNVSLMGLGAGHPDHMLNGLCFKAQAAFPGSRILDFSQSGTPTKPLSGNMIANVAVDGNTMTGTAVDGIYFSVHDGLMDFCHVAYCSGWGVRVQGVGTWTTYNTLLRATRVHNCNSGGFFFDDISTDCHDNECWSYYNGLAGQSGSTVNNANADGMVIKGSGHQSYGYHAYSNTGHGCNCFGVVASQMTGHYLENNGKAGFHADNTAPAASGFRLSNGYIWANSTVSSGGYDNVQLCTENSGANGGSFIIAGNHIFCGSNTNKPRWGVNLNSGQVQSTVVSDNILAGSYTSGAIHDNGSGVPGSQCFVVNNPGFNPVGQKSAGAIPTSGTDTVPNNFFNEPASVFISAVGGSITVIKIAGVTTGLTIASGAQAMIRVMPGQTVNLTYTGSPTWLWFLD